MTPGPNGSARNGSGLNGSGLNSSAHSVFDELGSGKSGQARPETDAGAAKSGSVHWGAAGSEPAPSGSAQKESAQKESAQPGFVREGSSQKDSVREDSARSESARLDSARSDSALADSAKSASAKSESAPSGVAPSGVAQPSLSHDGPALGSAPNGAVPAASAEPGSGEKGTQPAQADAVAMGSDSASLWPQFTADSSDPAPSTDRDAVHAESADAASSAEETRRAAHRLPTGAYPIVSEADGDDGASLRPRNEPQPEPADLFRPGARAEQKPPTGQPNVRRADATMQVAAVGHPVPQDGSVVPPHLGRNDGRQT